MRNDDAELIRLAGEHEAKIDRLVKDVAEVKQDVHEMKMLVAQIDGGRKVLWIIAAFLGSLLGWITANLFGTK